MNHTQTRHPNSRIVYLRRLPLVVHESNKELQADYFSLASRSIGSYFAKDSDRPGTGLTIGEENLLLPHVLNIPTTDRDFRQRVTDYFHEIHTRVKGSEEGTPLEIGLEYGNDKPISTDGVTLSNPPLNVAQYIAYRHAMSHPEVALSKEAGQGNPLKAYYIFDPQAVTGSNISISDTKDSAFEAYLEVKKDGKKVDMYLTLLGVRHYNMSQGDKILRLRKEAEAKPKAFLAIHADKDKELYYFIDQCIDAKVFKTVGTRILIAESVEEIGRDKQAAMLYLKDAKNNKTLLTMKAQLMNALRAKGMVEEPEPEVEEVSAPEPKASKTEGAKASPGLADLDPE